MQTLSVTRSFAIATAALMLFAAADWTRFRGPDATGVSEDTGLPTTWSANENVIWKTGLPGFGTSSPTTLGDKIFLTCYSGYGQDPAAPGDQTQLTLTLLCLNRADGSVLWSQSTPARAEVADYGGGQVNLHGYASSTPATDGEAVYVFFGRTGVMAYTVDGKYLWKTLVGDEIHKWGSATSPVLFGDLVIINASVESMRVVALNKQTGEQVWQATGIDRSWSTPLIVATANGSQELVVSMQGKILGLDPATGQELWHCDGVEDYTCPAVIANEGVVYVTAGRSPQFFAVRTGGRGDVTDSHTLWEIKATPKVSTPVYHQGLLYWVDQKGIAACVDAKTGKLVYEARLELKGARDVVYASLVLADGKIYGLSREDGAFVLAVGPEFQLLARNHLDDASIFNATPTISNGQLLIRSDKALYCIGQK